MVNGKSGRNLDDRVSVLAMHYSEIQEDETEKEILLILPKILGSLFVVGYEREDQSASFQPTVGERYHTDPRHDDFSAYIEFRQMLIGLKTKIDKTKKGEIKNAYGFRRSVELDRLFYRRVLENSTKYNVALKAYNRNAVTRLTGKKAFTKAQDEFNKMATALIQHIGSQIETYRTQSKSYAQNQASIDQGKTG